MYLAEGALEELNQKLQQKYRIIQQKEQRWEEYFLKEAQVIVVAYGTMARIARSAVSALRERGKKIGLLRPVSLWPFPINAFSKHLKPNTKYLAIEMSYGQMLEDVKLAVNGKCPVEFLGRAGGGIPTEEEIIKRIYKVVHSS